MFLPTLETLRTGDPFECSILPKRKRFKKSTDRLRSEALNLSRYLPTELKWQTREEHYEHCSRILRTASAQELEDCVADFEARMFRKRVVCSCWYRGEVESDAMWRIYAHQPGVCVVTTVGRLARSLKGRYSFFACAPNPQEYVIAPVRYVKENAPALNDSFYATRSWMLKRKSFAHENEVRLSHHLGHMATTEDGGTAIDVNAHTLVREIVLSPFNSSWENSSILSMLRAFAEARKLTLRVRKSGHMRSPASKNILVTAMEWSLLRSKMSGPYSHHPG
jgi:hypothetical protein